MAGGRLRVICGPTAAGKSQVALQLAKNFGGAIISADSRQIYKRFDIGTAKPNAEERSRVAHYGIDVVEPTVRYSAARWAADAEGWLSSTRTPGIAAVVVGGTGLYIKALVAPLFRAPELDSAARASLSSELEGWAWADLRRWCRELDPPRAHLGRTQILRALETALLSGQRISDLHAAHADGPNGAIRYDASYLLVDPGQSLAGRIEARVDDMLARGWREEVETLSRTVPPDAPAWKASGYSVMKALAAGEIDLSTARDRVIIETRQYAKRQRTWFRNQLPAAAVTLANPDDPAFRKVVRDWWEKAE